MSRRRWLSTDISKDARVRRLAADAGEFAALVYTWLIPHAADDGSLPDNADELLMLVTPGFRWRTAEDMQQAIEAMLKLDLLEQHGDRIRFPPAAFFRYQSYITAIRRESPQTDAEPRKTAPSSSSYLTSSSSLSLDPTLSLRANAHAPAREDFDPARSCSACQKRLPARRPKHGLCADCHGKALMAAKRNGIDATHVDLVTLTNLAIGESA